MDILERIRKIIWIIWWIICINQFYQTFDWMCGCIKYHLPMMIQPVCLGQSKSAQIFADDYTETISNGIPLLWGGFMNTTVSLLEPIDFILIIEHQAFIYTFIDKLFESITDRVVIITSRGYGDVSFQQFLNVIGIIYPNIPVIMVIDGDISVWKNALNMKYGKFLNTNNIQTCLPKMILMHTAGEHSKQLHYTQNAYITKWRPNPSNCVQHLCGISDRKS